MLFSKRTHWKNGWSGAAAAVDIHGESQAKNESGIQRHVAKPKESQRTEPVLSDIMEWLDQASPAASYLWTCQYQEPVNSL